MHVVDVADASILGGQQARKWLIVRHTAHHLFCGRCAGAGHKSAVYSLPTDVIEDPQGGDARARA